MNLHQSKKERDVKTTRLDVTDKFHADDVFFFENSLR